MFKVLIVDDEPVIRKGLINIINWKNFNCEVCGEGQDGFEGMEKIKELKPDIIFADINMPEVDGLEMIRQTKKLIPHSKMIILTGYRNFEYIQEAIRIGAFDYILKPSKIEKISDTLKRAVMELQYQQKKHEEVKKLQQHFENAIPILREKLLYDIIFRITVDKDEILKYLSLYQFQLREFVMLVIETDHQEKDHVTSYQRQLYQFGIINAFEDMFEDLFKVTKVSLNNTQIAFIIQPSKANEDWANQVNDIVENLQELVKNCFDFTITVAISSIGEGAFQLPDKFRECKDALGYKFYLGEDSVILYEDLKSFYRVEDDSHLQRYYDLLMKNIKAGNKEDTILILNELLNTVNETKTMNQEIIKTFYWNTIQAVNNIRISLKSQQGQKDFGKDITGLYQMIQECNNMQELHFLLEKVSTDLVEKINKFNKNSISLTLQKAIEYLQVHYNESINLNEVADYTYVSSCYLSRMFKKELGKNFVDYLNEIRIEKAKEYLKDVQYKTYEVAEMVGIQDPHYFSKLFKKHTGITPTTYRTSNTSS